MDDKRELNDILIGGEDVRSKNTKKLILLIIAIVVLIIAIAVIVLNLSSSNTEEVIVDVNSTGLDTNIPTNNEFNSIPVNDDSVQFEQIVKEIRSRQQNAPEQPSTSIPSAPLPSSNEVEKIQMPTRTPQTGSTRITSQPRTQVSQPSATSMPRGNNGDIAENGIYLQVGAFSKTPNKQFLDSVNKYSYRVQEIMINSKVITRYLIGPYANRSAAQRDVNAVSRDITTPVLLEIR